MAGTIQPSREGDILLAPRHAVVVRGSTRTNLGVGDFTMEFASDESTFETPNGEPIDTERNRRVTGTLTISSLSTDAIEALALGLRDVTRVEGTAVAAGTTETIGAVTAGELYPLSVVANDGALHVTNVRAGTGSPPAVWDSSDYEFLKLGSTWFLLAVASSENVVVTYQAYTPVRSVSLSDDGQSGKLGTQFELNLYSEAAREGDGGWRLLRHTVHQCRVQSIAWSGGSTTDSTKIVATYRGSIHSSSGLITTTISNETDSILDELNAEYGTVL